MISCQKLRCFAALCLLAFLCTITVGQEGSSSQSLGDVARKLRKDTTVEVRMTDSDSKKLFESVDRIFAFAARDTGLPRHSEVKRRLVSRTDVENYARGRMAKEEFTQRFATGELAMKKLGFLPREFNLKEYLVKSTGQEIAAYYDDETKTISMLNWVPPDQQEPILAHELTHALQDQNYGLAKWMKGPTKPDGAGANAKSDEADNDDGGAARKAVIEGQGMVVYVDYLLAPMGHSLEDSPQLLYSMEEPAVKAVQDSQMLHDAPMILRELGTFAYNEGLIFEGELLHKGGKNMAFAGVFARPPRNSHEVLQPEAYINQEKLPPVALPDLKNLLGEQYDAYDSGGIGQLDVRAFLKQYGERKNADEIASGWQGGAYAAYRSKGNGTNPAVPTTNDLALVYVSRWRTPQAAARYARFYVNAVAARYRNAAAQSVPACSGANCPASHVQIQTEEGPVIVDQADNTVFVSESFDAALAAKLQGAVRENASAVHAEASPQNEIGLRLFEVPAFQEFAERIGDEIAREMSDRRQVGRSAP